MAVTYIVAMTQPFKHLNSCCLLTPAFSSQHLLKSVRQIEPHNLRRTSRHICKVRQTFNLGSYQTHDSWVFLQGTLDSGVHKRLLTRHNRSSPSQHRVRHNQTTMRRVHSQKHSTRGFAVNSFWNRESECHNLILLYMLLWSVGVATRRARVSFLGGGISLLSSELFNPRASRTAELDQAGRCVSSTCLEFT